MVMLAGCGGSVGIGGSSGGVGYGAAYGPAMDKHKRDVEAWHEGRIKRLKSETGWLTLVGLFPVEDGTYTFGGAQDNDLVFPGSAPARAGTLTVAGGRVHLESAEGVEMKHEGKRVTSIDLATDKDGADPTEIRMGSYDFYVIDRPGTLYLRVKDSESEVRRSFTGIERFPVKKAWKVPARLERYDPPRPLTFANSMGFNETVQCPGALVFTIDGRECRLEPMSEEDGEMFIVFGDATSGQETYGGGRMIYIPSPDKEGKTYIDFNRAYNPPCVFTPYATCPLPHPENVLPVRIEAGEKTWEHGAH
jgi:uncharacterized protein (DUF1684 family)